MKLPQWEYKGFTIRKRDKGLHTSACDYDWSHITGSGLFWHYAPSLQSAKDDIDIHLIDQSFCEFNTGL